MTAFAAVCRVSPLLTLSFSLGASCAVSPVRELQVAERRSITLVVLIDFLRRNDPANWAVVFVSDEYPGFSIDSSFLGALPQSATPFRVARRAEAWVSPDIVRDGGLFLEPSSLEVLHDASVVQALRFSSTQEFGGELLYTLEGAFDRWLIKEVRVIWIV
jgi:hypothetical protein